jgi:hypothetical protein
MGQRLHDNPGRAVFARDQLTLPPLTLPFPQRLHPDADAAAAQARTWAARTGLYATPRTADRAYGQQCDRFAAWVYPAAPRDRLATLACLDLMMFLDDDHADEDAPRPHPLTASPLLAGVEEPMSPAWRSRFRENLAAWEQANIQSGARRADAGPPPPEEYIPWRRISSALLWHFDLIEYADGRELPDAFLSTGLYRRLIESAADVIAWTNDLFSAPKELARGEQSNLLAVLAHHRGISVQDAALLTVHRIATRVREFQSARADLLSPPGQDPAVQDPPAVSDLPAWADGLARWAGGNLGFCLASDRYPAQCD